MVGKAIHCCGIHSLGDVDSTADSQMEETMTDRYRPAEWQIDVIYECRSCGARTEMQSCYHPGSCACGGVFVEAGESYPGDVAEWDEERVDGEWRKR